MSAGNLELLARVQVAWGVPYRLHSSAAPTAAVTTQTVQDACIYTFSMRHIQMYKDRSMS